MTGAAVGMGAAFAAELARRGLSVLLVDVDEPALSARADELRGGGADVRTLVLDLGDVSAADRLREAAERHPAIELPIVHEIERFAA